MPTKNELKALLASGNFKEALQILQKIAEERGDNSFQNSVIHQASRFAQAQQENRDGVISNDNLKLELAKINRALLDLIDRMPGAPSTATASPVFPSENTPPPPNNPPFSTGTGDGSPPRTGTGDGRVYQTGTGDGGTKSRNIAWMVGLALLVGMVGLLVFVPCPTEAQFFGFRLALALAAGAFATQLPGMLGLELNNGIKATSALAMVMIVYFLNPGSLAAGGKCNNDPFNFTVRLKKADLPGYPPFRDGNLKIWVVNRYEKPELDSDLLAEVKGVPADQMDRKVDVALEGATYWKLAVDSVTLSNTSQTLQVVPDGSLDTLFGKVTVNGAPLQGATIEVEGGLSGTTDPQGKYAISIPVDKQRESLSVAASKDGYGKVEERHNPASGEKNFTLTVATKSGTSK